jgi:hypothetical protein
VSEHPRAGEGVDDAVLVQRVALGDTGVLAEIYDRYGTVAFSLARRTSALPADGSRGGADLAELPYTVSPTPPPPHLRERILSNLGAAPGALRPYARSGLPVRRSRRTAAGAGAPPVRCKRMRR